MKEMNFAENFGEVREIGVIRCGEKSSGSFDSYD